MINPFREGYELLLAGLLFAAAPYENCSAEIQKNIHSTYKVQDFSGDSEAVLLARLLFGEARNCALEEQIAVGYTVLNRMRDGKQYNGEGSVPSVALKPYQYSCFNSNDPNCEKLKDPERYDARSFIKCLDVAAKLLAGAYKDPTGGATHYYVSGSKRPTWADKLEKKGKIKTSRGVSKHEFYRER